MVELGIANIAMFFVIIGICLIFVITWIIKSESRINVCKAEIKRLKAQVATAEREKFMLSEKVNDLESAPPAPHISIDQGEPSASPTMVPVGPQREGADPAILLQALEQNATLERENKKLKVELDEATKSLEDIYKALVEKNA